MIRNKKGIAEVVLLLYVLGAVVLFFVPNPVSSAMGVGIRPNKTIETDKVTLINDKDGNPIAYHQVTQNNEVQQHVTFWEWLMSLPIFVLFLMGLGVIFPPVAAVLLNLRKVWKNAFKNTYDGLKSLKDTTVICRKCGDAVTIDTKEHVFDGIERKLDKKDKVLQEVVRTELTK